jgi:hypothetical protein
MRPARPCRICGRLACAAACLSLSATVLSRSLPAQSAAPHPPVNTVTAVSIGAVFLTTPMQPLLGAAPPGTPCDGECYSGTITLRANQRWQLQVRVDPAADLPVSVAWRPPLTTGARLPLDVTWTTIFSSPAPTAGTDVALQFEITPGPAGANGGDHDRSSVLRRVSAALQYRVVSWDSGAER